MGMNLSPNLEGELARAAGRWGISAELLIREAIERAVDYDGWVIRGSREGLAQIDAGEVLTHEAVVVRILYGAQQWPCSTSPLEAFFRHQDGGWRLVGLQRLP
jgi:predicted transcriptional regulator